MNGDKERSKLLARWLRHRPDAIGLALDKHGWADVNELLRKAGDAGTSLTLDERIHIHCCATDFSSAALTMAFGSSRTYQRRTFAFLASLDTRRRSPGLPAGIIGIKQKSEQSSLP
jgi:hypothetical protein